MKNRIFRGILLALLLACTPAAAQMRASLLTCGPGDDFYLAFGHSALRLYDPDLHIDYVYNYGTFDFDTPHFYLKFAQGQLDYCLSRTTYRDFVESYRQEGRWVSEQWLELDLQQVANLYLMLEWNYLPENRYYRYDFFRDNCATRILDMVESAAGHKELDYCDEHAGQSYRRMVHESAGPCRQWWTLGVDLLLGLRTDHRCNTREAMFHPLQMSEIMGCTTIMERRRPAGIKKAEEQPPLVAKSTLLLEDTRPDQRRSFPPVAAFALLLVAVALLSWKRLWPRWADRVLFVVAGLLGLFLCFMWFGTDHWCTAWNLNILWASPLLILIAIRLEQSPRWALWLQVGCFAVALLWVLVCGLSVALVPVILALALRVANLLRQ